MEDIDDDHSEDIYPPALPPKRGPLNSRGFSWTSGSPARPHSLPPRPQRSTSSDERIIPIVIERSGSATRPPPPQRQESTSSAISTAGEGILKFEPFSNLCFFDDFSFYFYRSSTSVLKSRQSSPIFGFHDLFNVK